MALNAKTENTTRIALNTNTDEWWLWTPNEDAMMALNTETRKATLNVKLGNDGGSARRNWECDEDSSEHWYWWVMALNAERRCDDGSEHWNRETWQWWLWTPKLKMWHWTLNWKHDDDSERRNWETMVALMTPNVINREWTVALNTNTKKWSTALKAKMKQRHLRTPKWNDDSERQTKRIIDECQSETKALHAQLNW